MDTIVQQTFVSPAKLDEDLSHAQHTTATATEQLAEQTTHLLDDIRKYRRTLLACETHSSRLAVFFQHRHVLLLPLRRRHRKQRRVQ